ncbi:hypothetical protein V1289_003118 [Bradyrhizobium sp. AZCC 2289]
MTWWLPDRGRTSTGNASGSGCKSGLAARRRWLATSKGRVYDPCCGSGDKFVQSEKFIESHGGKLGDIAIYGQESNNTTWRLCKMKANRSLRPTRGSGRSPHCSDHPSHHEPRAAVVIELVPRHSGYDSLDVTHFGAGFFAAFRCRSHASISRRSQSGSSILRSRHWPRSTPISISTMLSQLACLGV